MTFLDKVQDRYHHSVLTIFDNYSCYYKKSNWNNWL